MNCKICSSQCTSLFMASVLHKYDIEYFQCNTCSFIQTEEVFWIEEAYSNAITSLDIGLISRNYSFAKRITSLLHRYFGSTQKYLDYGGGYGMFVRLMRDRGLNFYRQDIYCENLFAKHFDLTDLEQDTNFILLTAFEVFEHLVSPLEEIEKMFVHAPSILFSTILQPKITFSDSDDWWYFIPETGQHVALYTYASLEIIAKKFNKKLYSDGTSLHLFTDKELPLNVLKKSLLQKVIDRTYGLKTKGLLQSDFDIIRKKLNNT